MWQPIEEAPELERLMVAGYHEYRWEDGTVKGYWWYHEDSVYKGQPIENPNATHFTRLKDILPPFPGEKSDS